MKYSDATLTTRQRQWFALLIAGLFFFLLAPAAQAQNSYNRWTARPPATIEPLQKKQRAPKPQEAAQDTTEKPRVAQSKLLKRGLGSRMRQGQSLPEDSISMVFFSRIAVTQRPPYRPAPKPKW